MKMDEQTWDEYVAPTITELNSKEEKEVLKIICIKYYDTWYQEGYEIACKKGYEELASIYFAQGYVVGYGISMVERFFKCIELLEG